MKKRYSILLLLLLSALPLFAIEYADSAIFQGVHVKLDLGNSVYQLAKTRGKTQQYEALVSVNLLKWIYPTIELGYGMSEDQASGGAYKGAGGFTRLGLDINPLKQNRNNDYALLVGLRLGVAAQGYSLSNVTLNGDYWTPGGSFLNTGTMARGDCWGEVCASAQVKVAGPFFMGWAVRMHFLFTKKGNPFTPYYIPGYGNPESSPFTFNYYVGLRF